jgi:hypothetical protein
MVPGIVGEPIIFWKFDTVIFECDYRVEQQTAKNGDVCHFNIWDVPDGELYRLIEHRPLREFSVCADGNHRPLEMADFDSMTRESALPQSKN